MTTTAWSTPTASFDQHHFARGVRACTRSSTRTLATPEDGIGWAVSTYQPDVVIEVLGTNDLLYGSSPEDALDVAQQFVSEVRAARPDTALVLSTAPDIGYSHFSEYDDLLTSTAAQWSTPESPVVVSTPEQGWVGAVDTCDSTHPSAIGEVKIAAAQADALAALGIGAPAARPLPEPPVGPRQPATLTGMPGDGQVALSWQLPPGGTAVLISTRDATLGEDWHQLPYAVSGTAWLSAGLTDGDTYEYRLNVLKHDCLAADVVSDVVSATPTPAVPGAVTGVTVESADHGLHVAWSSASGATSYQVWVRPTGEPTTWQTVTTTATSDTVDGLLAGASYDVSLQAVGTGGAGPLSAPVSVTAGGVVPSAPSVTGVATRGDGSATMTWTMPGHATHFVVAHRDARRGSTWVTVGRTVTEPTAVVYGLRSGGSYLFRVTALDDRLVGGTSGTVRGTVPRVAPVRDVRLRRSDLTSARSHGDTVRYAESYVLQQALSSGCDRVPAAIGFKTRARGLSAPRETFPLPHPRAGRTSVWVRWYAVRDGVRGRTSASSAACLRLPR